MRLRFLGKGGSDTGGCPTLYANDQGSYLIQGWKTEALGTVEIPHLLLGFTEPDSFVGALMTDTGRGTFSLAGRLVNDPETLSQLALADDETAIEVPKLGRTFYGAVAYER